MVCVVDWDALRLAWSKVQGSVARNATQWLHGWLPLKVPGHCVCCKDIKGQDHL